MLVICLGVPFAQAASSVSQFGITWTFDRDYPTGRFANGDNWVVGPVKIVSISPRSTVAGGVTLNGSMVNPPVNGAQAYDSRMIFNNYDPRLNVGAQLPLALGPGSSLLSSQSQPLGSALTAASRGDARVFLRTIAVLTVLDRPAPAGSFRPPYVGTNKPVRWNESQLRYDRLRSLPRVPHAPAPDTIAAGFARPWIEQTTTWNGRYLHPELNQPAYGRDLSHRIAEGLLTLQLDYSSAEKRNLLVNLVQYGIDVYGAAAAGAVWPAGGGHNHGRKMPLLLASTILNDPAMMAYADGRRLIFQEDRQTWYVTQSDVGRPLYAADRRPRVPYIQSDVGIPEWGEKHYPEPQWDGRNWGAYYRNVAGSSTIGHVLTARLMGLQDKWNWPAIFDYYDRYWAMENGTIGQSANSIQTFVAEMWKAYRNATAAQFFDQNVATEIWENTPLRSQSGQFTVAFDMMASDASIDGVTGVSNGGADSVTDLAAAVRFAPSGRIEASNGSVYQAANTVTYTGGVKYRITLTVDTAARQYSATVAAPGKAPVQIANRWKFRPEQSRVSSLNNLGYRASGGYHALLNVGLQSPSTGTIAVLGGATDAVLSQISQAASAVWGVNF